MKNFLAKVDLHLHSKASNKPFSWFTSLINCAESYSEPKELYKILLKRGMTFVTITDHDSIDGVSEIAHLPKVFISAEYTVAFPEEDAKIHVLVYGLNETHHQELLRLRENVYDFVKYLKINKLPHSLAHPLYSVEKTILTKELVEKFVLLFDLWEIINGMRGKEVRFFEENIARIYDCWEMIYFLAEKYGIEPLRSRESISFTAGSDDHGGLDAGTTWTAVKEAKNIEEFLEALRNGETYVESYSQSEERLLNTVTKVGFEFLKKKYQFFASVRDKENNLNFERFQSLISKKDFLKYLPNLTFKMNLKSFNLESIGTIGASLFFHFLPLILKYFQVKDQKKIEFLSKKWGLKKYKEVKIAYLTDTYTHINGVALSTKWLREIAEKEGFPIDFIISSPEVSSESGNLINFEPLFEVSVPFYQELKMGVPNLLELADFIEEKEFTGIHIATPGPLGLAGLLLGKILGLKISLAFHTDLPNYIKIYSKDLELESMTWKMLIKLSENVDCCFAPSHYYSEILIKKGISPSKIKIFKRGVDLSSFSPSYKNDTYWKNKLGIKGISKVILYVGRISKEKNLELFLKIATHFPKETFIIVGDGPYREELEKNKPENVFFIGYLRDRELSQAYASSDIFLFPSETETYGLVILEAMASGLPVLVSSRGASKEHLTNEIEGFVCNNLQEYLDKLNLLLSNKEIYVKMRERALEKAKKLDFEKSYKDYLNEIIAVGKGDYEGTGYHHFFSPSERGDKKISLRES